MFEYVLSGCRKPECLNIRIFDDHAKRTAYEKQTRFAIENKTSNCPIAKLALRRCLERIRKQTGKSLKHWCVTELGGENDRIHLHGIVFGQRAAEVILNRFSSVVNLLLYGIV